MKTLYPNLYEFLGGYFHQDWSDESPTAVGVVERYVSEWPVKEVDEALAELRKLLVAIPDEAELENAIHELGSYYNPKADGITYREWLMQVCKQLERDQ